MNTRKWTRSLAVGLVALTALAGVASAQPRNHGFLGTWRLESRQGQDWGRNIERRMHDGAGDHGDSRGSPQYGWNDSRGSSRQGWNGSRGSRFGTARLPQTFRIDRERRSLQVETMDGRVIRELQSARNRQLTSHRTSHGRTFVDTYSLTDRGRRLVVRTVVRGPRGTRETTRTYLRA
jgi:hypothetical protein